ncbi:protein mono-ADP-ribosyltransferase PARP4 isoform X3 [Micropterus dolomieu]|uniref:protein mono-ADP-ribosyltransferase PARP4 isoform X3 n=1 Tax=Micropterus dolomieu TaxID=147949 RepID=UPI001E8E5995|nr:protein mono-ADP-ribosyltransferase PARP4 isoform X3 [Micropterus dolomieu]
MAVFKNCSVLFELKNLPFKEKKQLKSAVTENGGNISFVVNNQCSLIVTSDPSNLSSSRLRGIQKYQIPVVGVDYVYSCLEKGVFLPVDEYKLDSTSPVAFSPPLPFSSETQSPLSHKVSKVQTNKAVAEPSKGSAGLQRAETPERSGNVLEKFRIYTETDSDLPTYPDNFEVAKYSIFEKTNSNFCCVLELQSFKGDKGRQYRVVRCCKANVGAKKVKDMLVFPSTSEEAVDVYEALREKLHTTGLQLMSKIPPQALDLGSNPLQQLLLEEKLNTGSLSQEVGVFVELLWTEALGCLDSVLRVSIDKLSLNDVSRVEGLLLQAQRKLREANQTEMASLLDEVYTLLPHREPPLSPTAKLISQKLDLCQLIRDVLNVSEMTLRSPVPSCLGKYRALRCSIETVPPSSSEFQAVTSLLQGSKVQIQRVLRVSRGVELQMFKSELGNIKPLLHSSSPRNFVGVLSRGLLLPRVGVEHHGIERTDVGNLGSGIYFSDAMSTSLKYSKPSETDGSRLLLVCDVALGRCKDVHKRDLTLTQAPEGHHSVHGVRSTHKTHSEFEDDEYVVYSPEQVKLKYVVQFSIEGDQIKEFSPAINTSAEPSLPSSDQELGLEDDGVESIKNPLEGVTAGLLDSSGQQLPLQAVHVKCKLMDLLSQVVIFQKYTNLSSVPIEAKYVFPLDDSAAVCGFEAFINGKHVVGQVKEKETARKEYRQAIEKGHGAYLMDQDAPDVFTISVGNLPPGATVLIKVTFVSELIVRDGSILFSLPGSVAPWQEGAALNQTTQVTVEKVCVTDEEASTREFTLDMSIEMPYEISSLKSTTHKIKMKRTDCKAVVSVLPGEVMGPEGFQLSVTLSEVHLPRMWVEKHPDKDSQACMLVFYPDFDINSISASDEVVLLLDTSESMKGESLRIAQRIALQVLKTLDRNLRLNVIFFGTDHTETFPTAQPLAESRQAAESFIKLCSSTAYQRFSPVGGSTELWRPLRALSLLPPSRGVRNLLLLSDGHIQNAELTLQLLRDNAQHSRLFTCGLSPTANRHMLRALAQAGGGAFEFFDTKTKHNWAEKVARQVKRMASPGCSSVSVKWQQFNPTAPPPVQAPKHLHALFNDCHTLVYGFVPHCTQATLLGNLSGQELKTMVSTSELQKTRGTFLHKLTARALIRDYEDGSLDTNEAEHEGKKAELKRFIIELSREFSILSQFTSFVAIEERDSEQTETGFTDIPKLIAEEDVDVLPYISWISPQDSYAEGRREELDLSDLITDGIFENGSTEGEEECFETLPMERACFWEGEDERDILEGAIASASYLSMEDNYLDDDEDEDKGGILAEEAEVSQDYSPASPPCSVTAQPQKYLNTNQVLERDSKRRYRRFIEEVPEKLVSSTERATFQMDLKHTPSLGLCDSIYNMLPTSGASAAPQQPCRIEESLSGSALLPSQSQPVNFSLFGSFPHFQSEPTFSASADTLPPPPSIGRSSFGFSPAQFQSEPTFSASADTLPPPPSIGRRLLGFSLAQIQSEPAFSASAETLPPPPSIGRRLLGFSLAQIQSEPAFSASAETLPPPPSIGRRLLGFSLAQIQSEPAFSASAETLPPPPSIGRRLLGFSLAQIQSEPAFSASAETLPPPPSIGRRLLGFSLAQIQSEPAFSASAETLPPPPSIGRRLLGFSLAQIQSEPAFSASAETLPPPPSIGRRLLGFSLAQIQSEPAFSASAETLPPPPSIGRRLLGFSLAQIQSEPAFSASAETLPPPPSIGRRLLGFSLAQIQSEPAFSASADTLPPPPSIGRSSFSPSPAQFQSEPAFSASADPPPPFSDHPFSSLHLPCSAPPPKKTILVSESLEAHKSSEPQDFGSACYRSISAPPVPQVQLLKLASHPLNADTPSPVDAPKKQRLQEKIRLRTLEFKELQETQPVEFSSGTRLALRKYPLCLKRRSLTSLHHMGRRSAVPEALKLRWTKIFQMQHSEGYWELTTELGEFINVDVDVFANVFLKSKGISSLGVRAHADILKLVATLLVLQLMRVENLEEGKLLRTLFCMDDSSQPRPEWWEEVKKAVDWVRWADRQYPCVYSRLEFGSSWESSTRQLLGYEGLPPFSPLSGLNLQRNATPVLVH